VRSNSIDSSYNGHTGNDPCPEALPPQTGAVLAHFRAGLAKVEAAELARLYDRLPELDENSKVEIQQFADRVIARFILPPVTTLRGEASNGADGSLLDALQRLFQLPS
jgi:glutamyl-tRNA reductase